MAITSRKITTYAKNIVDLSDQPNKDGLTGPQLKAMFDGRTDEEVKTSINGIVDDLVATTDGASGADQIGATPLPGGTATKVQGVLEEINGSAVHLAGVETVTGVKTFSSSPIVPTPTTDMQASTKKYVDDTDGARKTYVDNLDALAVHLAGNETITGIKTFSASPVVPAPTTDTQAATKKYVDDVASEKVDTADIVNDLTTGGEAVPLSAEQGKELKTDIGNQTFTEQNYVTDGESSTASIDALDIELKDVNDRIGNQTFTEDNYVTDGASDTANIDALDMAIKDNADLISNMSVVLSDLTFNAAWKDGASADAGTNVITLAGHGFVDNQPIEFGPGTGALPAGISAYNVDTKGGEYYYVISKTTDTFKISLTRGGAEVDITSAGAAGWQVRLGFIPVLPNPVTLSSSVYKKIKVEIRGSIASGYTSFYPNYYLSFTSTDRQIFRVGSQWGNVIDAGFLTEPNTAISKYNFSDTAYDMDIIGTMAWIRKNTMILSSADKSSGALLADTQQAAMINFGSITSVNISSTQIAVSGFRSGTRVIITGAKI